MKIYTANFANIKKHYAVGEVINITVKNGNKAFAPSWDMVLGHKAGKVTDAEYTAQYYDMMRKSYVVNRSEWDTLLNKDAITLVCFCHEDKFCHRHILRDMLVKLGAEFVEEI